MFASDAAPTGWMGAELREWTGGRGPDVWDQGPRGYDLFKNKEGCVRAVFQPGG